MSKNALMRVLEQDRVMLEQFEAQLRAAEAQLKALDEQIKQQRSQLNYYRVTAPIAGTVESLRLMKAD